ncbi:MAG: ribosome silencing factor [Flavobacteriaceae bacterium]|nr:ribosome silencing factor [Flavobacteriaceae bacterium]
MSSRTKSAPTTQQLVDSIVRGMQELKASKIIVLDMRNLKGAITDYFVICHAESNRQVEAIAKSIDGLVKKETGEDAWHTEGRENAEWILLDYINVVAHVFEASKRDFFGLEELWGDAEIQTFE